MVKIKKIMYLLVLISLLVISKSIYAEIWSNGSCATRDRPTSSYFACSLKARSPYEYCESLAKSAGWNVKRIEYSGGSWTYCDLEHPTYSPSSFVGGPLYARRQAGRRHSRTATPDIDCPDGEIWNSERRICEETPNSKCKVGNPIVVTTGNKVAVEIDYKTIVNGHEVNVIREYQSSRVKSVDSRSLRTPWEFTFTDRVSITEFALSKNHEVHNIRAKWIRPHEADISFEGADINSLEPTTNITRHKINPILTLDGSDGWVIESRDGMSRFFNSNGLLRRVRYQDGTEINIGKDSYGNITHESMGRTLFKYGLGRYGRIESVIVNEIPIVRYAYDVDNNLYQTIKENGEIYDYIFENSNFPNAITGVYSPEFGRIKTWEYDDKGRAIRSYHGNEKNDTKLIFNESEDGVAHSVTVTNPLGKNTIYHLKDNGLLPLIEQVEGVQSEGCAAANKSYEYNLDGTLKSKTDWLGNITYYQRDEYGRETKRIEALGTVDEITTTTEWDPDFDRKLKEISSIVTRVWEYNQYGKIKKITEYPTLEELR